MRSATFDPTHAPWNTKQGTEPVYVVAVDWAAGEELYGTWGGWSYSGTSIIDRVESLGKLTQQLSDMADGGLSLSALQGKVPTVDVVLRDEDRTLWAKSRDAAAIQGRTAAVYLAAKDGNPKYMKLFDGIVSSRPQWRNGRLHLHLSSGALSKVQIGTTVTEEDFPAAWPDHQGKMLPIVFGAAHKVQAMAVLHGRSGTLRAAVDDSSTTLYIDGWQDRGGETITLMIGKERLVGTFDGSEFTATERGGGTIASGTIRADVTRRTANILPVNASDLGTIDNAYNGYFIKLTVPQFPDPGLIGWSWSAIQGLRWYRNSIPSSQWGPAYRQIYRYDATNENLYFTPTFTYEDSSVEDRYIGRTVLSPSAAMVSGRVYLPPQDDAYTITTMAMEHKQGERVWEIPSGGQVVYIIADHPISVLQGVFVKGKRKEIDAPRERYAARFEYGGSVPGMPTGQAPNEDTNIEQDNTEGEFVELHPENYQVNLNDTTTFPSLGHAVSTIKFNVPLPLLPGWDIATPDLYCNVKGHSNPTYVTNPVTVLARIIDNWTDISRDTAAWTTAATSVDWLKCAFSLIEKQDAQRLAADIAWQARCRVFWRDGLLSIKFLKNIKPATYDTHIGAGYEEGSHRITWRGIEQIITEIEYKIRTAGDGVVYKEEDTAAIAAYGRRGIGVKDFWIYEEKNYAQAVARFMLNRMKYEAMKITVTTPLSQARVELGDWIKLYPGAMFGANQYGEVVDITHTPVNVQNSEGPSIDIGLLMPYGWEATWTCPSGDVCYACDVTSDAIPDLVDCSVAADVGCGIFDLGGYADWGSDADEILATW